MNRPGASQGAIQYHYDVSDEFYSLFLDERMVYSAALWLDEDDTLEQAQVNKLDWHINQSRVRDGFRVLDVGCGWGALLRRLSERFPNVRSTGLTLSESQEKSIRSNPVPGATVHLEGWQEHTVSEPYDAMVSIGAFEHFAKPDLSWDEKVGSYASFFQWCHKALRAGGCLALQTISFENTRPGNYPDFTRTEIFPESELPRLSELSEAASGLFEIEHLQGDRAHYARTTRAWLSRLKKNKKRAIEIVGTEIYQRYVKYLSLSVVGFHTGKINLLRLRLRRIDNGYAVNVAT